MALRTRLTLLYIALLGVILLVFGVVIYGSVNYLLSDQVNQNLARSFGDVYSQIIANQNQNPGKDLLSFSSPDPTLGIYVQAWSRTGQLVSTNIPNLNRPLDPTGLQSSTPVFRDVFIQNLHLRILSVPLVQSSRQIGVIQIATSMAGVDNTQRILVIVLVVGSLIALALAGLAGWLSTRRALAPLKSVTETALQITRADDLSRRISYQGPPDDEVGQLIRAFNQTLSRLENLFNTQRRFLADVGHELRTPLTVIKGNVDLMRRFGTMDEESLASIEDEVDRLTRLVGDLLLLAQAESGKLPLDMRVVELDTLLLEALQQMRVLAGDRLKLRIGEIDQTLVCGDRDRLKQVLVNLMGNAIQYTPSGGEVIVGLGKAGEQAKLTVSDTGPGIPPEDLPHVFERFYRGEKARTRSRDGKGFGLGLSIAYWIVRNHEGRIEVDSKEGQGTTFCVWLPLAQDGCTA